MAENKKSFLLYCDLIHTIKKMPKDKAGELFMTILEYANNENPEPEDIIVSLVFEPIKQSLKRDLEKYERVAERNRANGAKGGRPKYPKKPTGLSGMPNYPRKADSDSDIGNDSDNDIDNDTTIDNIEARKLAFKNNVWNKFKIKYSEGLLKEFCLYWSEHGERDKKMRFEKEKSFGLSRRLSTWSLNDKKFNNKNNGTETTTPKNRLNAITDFGTFQNPK